MKLSLIKEKGFEPVLLTSDETEVVDAYTSDLLSDVLSNAKEDSILITIQAHKNTVAVCSIVGIKAIIICNNRNIPEDMKELAQKENISIFKTPENQFKTSYMIYLLLKETM